MKVMWVEGEGADVALRSSSTDLLLLVPRCGLVLYSSNGQNELDSQCGWASTNLPKVVRFLLLGDVGASTGGPNLT